MSRFSSARRVLEESLENSAEHSLVRSHAAEALAYLEISDSTEVVSRHLSDPDVAVQYWVIFALGTVGGRSVIPALRTAAERAGDARCEGRSLKDEAMNAIARIEAR